nr:glycosyltransferase [uncultured Carboxylicivirga sp.]
MKKSIFITMQYLELGGAERSLIGFLDAIDYSKYDVDVFIQHHKGELMDFINPKANLLPENPIYASITKPIKQVIKHGYWKLAINRLKVIFKYKFSKYRKDINNIVVFQMIADAIINCLPPVNDKEYDLAISFLIPHQIVRSKVKARKKAAWIHTDYSTVKLDINAELPVWNSFDYIAAISESAKDAFCLTFPSLQSKTMIVENMLSSLFVNEQANLEEIKLDGEVKLLSVGRFCHAKAFDNAVFICAELVKMGVNLKWYIIGFGDQKSIDEAIRECGMEEHFILLGKKSNPYPYMRACDIYVQPSRYEGKAVTVREAQMLCKPVVITNFSTSQGQLTDGVDGVIVPMDILGAAMGIKDLIDDVDMQNKLINNCRLREYGNFNEVEKVYKMCN